MRAAGPDVTTDPSAHGSLSGCRVVICVCGGIAAYKTAALVSQLVQEGCRVTVAMTRAARRFVGPTTFRALTGRPVLTSLWDGGETPEPRGGDEGPGGRTAMRHLGPTEDADLVVVAPATANMIGKLAGGIADDLVSTLLIGAACPVLLAPAMNARMWQHPAVQRNVAFLRNSGFQLVGPEEGWLACGVVGHGRMSEPETLLAVIRGQLERLRAGSAGPRPA